MKFLKGLLITIFVLLIVVAVGGYLFLKNFDINKYVPFIEQKVEDSIGRKIVIGNASIKLSLIPTVVVEDVYLSNAQWAEKQNMVEAKKVELQVEVMPLLQKELVIKKFVVDEAQIYLQTDADGKGNWVFDMPTSAAKTSYKFELIASAHAQVANEVAIPNIGLEHIAVNNSVVVFDAHTIDIKSFDLSMPDKNSKIHTAFDLAYNGESIVGTSVLGSVNELMSAAQKYPLEAKIVAKGINADFNGVVVDALQKNPSVEGAINVYNPASNMNLPEVSLSAKIKASAKMFIADIDALNVAQNLVTGRVHANLEGKPFVDVFVASDLINLETLRTPEPLAFDIPDFISTANATALVPATPIDYNLLNVIDGKATLRLAKLVVNKDITLDNINLVANVNNGVLLLKPVELSIGDGHVFATASVDASVQTINANIKSENIKLQDINKEFLIKDAKDFGIVSGGVIDVDANLIAKGATAKELVEGLNGRAIIIANKSIVQTGKTAFLDGFLGTILNAIKLGNVEKNKELDMSCAVINSDIKNGVLNFNKGIALQSKDISLVADGYVSLGNDKIALNLHPYTEDIANTSLATSLGGLLKLSGTIQKPTVALDEKQAIKTIVGVLATGGASYVGTQAIVDSGSSPCYTALLGTGMQDRFPKPKAAAQVYDDSAKVVNESAKAVGTGINKIGESTEDTVKAVGNLLNNFLKK